MFIPIPMFVPVSPSPAEIAMEANRYVSCPKCHRTMDFITAMPKDLWDSMQNAGSGSCGWSLLEKGPKVKKCEKCNTVVVSPGIKEGTVYE